MNSAKIIGGAVLVGGRLTTQDWIQILGIMIVVLGMLQDYLKERKN